MTLMKEEALEHSSRKMKIYLNSRKKQDKNGRKNTALTSIPLILWNVSYDS